MHGWKFIHRKQMSRAFCSSRKGEAEAEGGGKEREEGVGVGGGGDAKRFYKSMEVWMLLQPKL